MGITTLKSLAGSRSSGSTARPSGSTAGAGQSIVDFGVGGSTARQRGSTAWAGGSTAGSAAHGRRGGFSAALGTVVPPER